MDIYITETEQMQQQLKPLTMFVCLGLNQGLFMKENIILFIQWVEGGLKFISYFVYKSCAEYPLTPSFLQGLTKIEIFIIFWGGHKILKTFCSDCVFYPNWK